MAYRLGHFLNVCSYSRHLSVWNQNDKGPDNQRLERYLKTDEFFEEEVRSNLESKLEKRLVLHAFR